jgi:hypothetical protein
VRAEPPVDPAPDPAPLEGSSPADPPATDPATTDPGNPVDTAPPDAPEQPTFTVRTGRAGDPAAIATSLADTTGAPTAPSSKTTRTANRRHVGSTEPDRTAVLPLGSDRASHRSGDASTITPVPAVHVPAAAPTAVATSAASSHSVVAGDNLWSIAASHLASVTGRDVATLSTAEIVRYWVRVCDDNRAHLRSGNVSLIYAGEIIELPAV